MEDMIADRVGAKEAELHATYDERLRNYDERYAPTISLAVHLSCQSTDLFTFSIFSEKDLQRQVTVARSQLRELRTTNDSSQAKLFDHSQRQGEPSD